MKKRNVLLTTLLLLLLLLVGCGQQVAENPAIETYTFTDSAGRTVDLPKQIDRIAPSGSLAQMALFAIAPDKLVGVSGQWKDTALPYVGDQYRDLPILGQFYGMKNFNKEAVLSVNPQVIIDVGEKKATIVEDMDQIQSSLGIPTIFIEARLDNTDVAYRTLGKILGREAEGNALADYCQATYTRSKELAAKIQNKPSFLYLGGPQGNMAVARGSFHAQIVDLLADNVAVTTAPSEGSMSQVSKEQILAWDPEVLVIATETEADRTLSAAGITVIMTTHAPSHAFYCADRTAVMGRDGMFFVGQTNEIITEERLEKLYGVTAKIVGYEHIPETRTCVPLPPQNEKRQAYDDTCL